MMNLKYYLRGLGIGIIVTALIMGLTAGRKESLSNAEIKERAKALGMVEEENTLLKDLENQKQDQAAKPDEPVEPEEKQETSGPELSEALESSPEPGETEPAEDEGESGTQASEVNDAQEAAALPEATMQPDGTPEEPEQDLAEPEEENQDSQVNQGSVTIQISRGDGSYSVCKKLEAAGLIDSVTAYDQFLYQNGYDKKIRAGSVEIPAGADGEQIARIICGMD